MERLGLPESEAPRAQPAEAPKPADKKSEQERRTAPRVDATYRLKVDDRLRIPPIRLAERSVRERRLVALRPGHGSQDTWRSFFCLSANLTLARLGSFAALNSPTWAAGAYERWQNPLLIASIFGIMSVRTNEKEDPMTALNRGYYVAAGLAMVGVFHSHPTGRAYPSPVDVEKAYWPGTQLPNYPDTVQVIVSLLDPAAPVARGYSLQEGTISEVPLSVE